jgi:hypothetical protein
MRSGSHSNEMWTQKRGRAETRLSRLVVCIQEGLELVKPEQNAIRHHVATIREVAATLNPARKESARRQSDFDAILGCLDGDGRLPSLLKVRAGLACDPQGVRPGLDARVPRLNEEPPIDHRSAAIETSLPHRPNRMRVTRPTMLRTLPVDSINARRSRSLRTGALSLRSRHRPCLAGPDRAGRQSTGTATTTRSAWPAACESAKPSRP